MFAVNTFEEIVKSEESQKERHLIMFLFVRPSLDEAKEIIGDFNYLHYNAGRYCSIYAVGYSDNPDAFATHQTVRGINGQTWHYSDQAFVEFKDKLESRLKWRYCGKTELVLLQSNPQGTGDSILDFKNYYACNIGYALKNGYIASFQEFMEALIRSSKSRVNVSGALGDIKNRFDFKKLLEMTLASIDVPLPVRKLINDRIFFKTSRSYA